MIGCNQSKINALITFFYWWKDSSRSPFMQSPALFIRYIFHAVTMENGSNHKKVPQIQNVNPVPDMM